jgi:hypothetical protein
METFELWYDNFVIWFNKETGMEEKINAYSMEPLSSKKMEKIRQVVFECMTDLEGRAGKTLAEVLYMTLV